MASDRPQLELWSHVQNQHAELFRGSHPRLQWLVRRAERFAGARRLLNIGCGDGFLERAALRRGWKVVSVDPDAESVKRLLPDGIDARCGRIEALPAENSSADVIICTEVFEHLPPETMNAGLRQIRR